MKQPLSETATDRLVLAGILIGVVILFVTVFVSISFVRSGGRSSEKVQLSHETVLTLERMLSSLKDAESGSLGYLLTGEETYLLAYQSGREQARAELATLEVAHKLQPLTQREFQQLDAKVRSILSELEQTVNLRRNQQTQVALALVKTSVAQDLMSELRVDVSRIEFDLQQRLLQQFDDAAKARDNGVVSNLVGSLLLFGFVTVFATFVVKGVRARRRAELELQQQQEWFRTTLLSLGDGVIATDAQGEVVLMNAVAERLTGWSGDEAVHHAHEQVFKIAHEATREPLASPLESVLREGVAVVVSEPTVLIARDGSERPIDDSGAPIRGAHGEVVGAVLVFRDVTARKRAEAELRSKEEFNRKILESSADCIQVIDQEGRLLSMNRPGLELMEIDDFALLRGRSWAEMWGDAAPLARDAMEAARSGASGRFQARNATAKGITKFWDVLVTPLADDRGVTTNMVCISRDMSALAFAQEALRERDARLSTIFSQVTVGIAQMDLRGRFLIFNERFGEIVGRDGLTLSEMSFEDVAHADERGTQHATFEAVARGEGRVSEELRFTRADGEHVWVECGLDAITGDRGIMLGVVAVVQDITERKLSEIERERLVAVVQNSSDFICISDLDAHPISINPAGLVLLGVQGFAQIERMTVTDFFASESRAFLREHVIPEVRAQGRWSGELNLRQPVVGASTPVLCDVFRIDDPHTEQPMSLATVARDITERKRAESEREKLLANERVARSESERIGRVKDEFLATLSHELRTPLNAILGWAQLLRKAKSDGEDLERGLETIERNARVQAQMIEELLEISRIISGKVRLDTQRVDVLQVVQAALDSIQPTAQTKDIRVQAVLDPRTNVVNGDPTRLQQVVWNLLSNAVKFTPKGGKIQVVLRRHGSQVVISVGDTGKGIAPEFLPHVFERFRQEDASTTRKFGGLGLGLAIVKQLVELHGGTVRAESAGEGLGATFHVELPVAVVVASEVEPKERAADRAPSLEAIAASMGGVRVLVVDDEPDSRDLMVRILRSASVQVVSAPSVERALELMPTFRPDVLLSDIGMPDADGYELIRRVRQLGEEHGGTTPAAALTALARSEDRTRALLAGYQLHVAKPIEPAELVAVVASLAALKTRHRG